MKKKKSQQDYKREALAKVRDRIDEILKFVNEDPKCPHCRFFQFDMWDGVVPSRYKNFVRPCGLHKGPRYPNIAANRNRVMEAIARQLDRFEMSVVDWDALEDQL